MIYDQKWEKFYNIAKKFYEENQHLDIPQKCIIDGFKIGLWINNQRRAYTCIDGSRRITKEQIDKLNEIGMIWKKREDWNINYELVKKFYKIYNNLDIPDICKIDGIKIEGLKLQKWLSSQRRNYQNNILSEEKINKLNEIGIIWNLQEASWKNFYELAKQFYIINGHLDIPQHYIVNNKKLGRWISRQRLIFNGNGSTTGILTQEQIDKLNKIGMIWNTKKYKLLHMDYCNLTNKYYINKRLLTILKETLIEIQNKEFNNNDDVKEIEKILRKKLDY